MANFANFKETLKISLIMCLKVDKRLEQYIIPLLFILTGCGSFETQIRTKEEFDASNEFPIQSHDASISTNVPDASDGAPPFIFVKSIKTPSFTDDFERANNTTLGNGWAEKTDSFSILNGAVILDASGPPVERIARRISTNSNIEILGKVTILSEYNEISLFARMQSDEISGLVGYRAWFAVNKIQIERRINSTGIAKIAEAPIYPKLEIGITYDFHMRIIGEDVVTIEAGIFSNNTHIQSLKADDFKERITASGQVGFGNRYADGTRWESISIFE